MSIYDITEQDEIEMGLHPLNGKEADHYPGGKPDVCPQCALEPCDLAPFSTTECDGARISTSRGLTTPIARV